MSNSLLRNVRVTLVIAVLIVYFGYQREVVVEAAPAVIDMCFAVCDEHAGCLDPCMVEQGPELPTLEITCGMYDGGPVNDWCDGNGCADQCAWYWSSGSDVCYWENEPTTCEDYGVFGYCGDDTCVAEQGETCSNCAEDCSVCDPAPTCDNDVCEPGETFRSCWIDCETPGYDLCGDDQCGFEEDGDNCPEDCTFSRDWCGDWPVCPTGWECVDDLCVWETDPLYKCCGGGLGGPDPLCASTEAVCNANEICKPSQSLGGKSICQPRFEMGGPQPRR